MRFDTKIAIVVRAGLEQWQQLNVTAFLASGIAAANPETIGKPYEDGAGNTYTELFRQPVLVYEAEDLSQVHARALARGMSAAVYTTEMFGTGNDDDNRAVVVAASVLDLAGIAVYGPRNAVDKVIKGVTLHP
ncbi:MAG TPA: DUF2000 domain-containing protein [Streptosporangiaceae bacterium]|jgi:hypothetical protein